jgi:formylglycine-generating enzyme required for sulfatase activity
MEYVCGTTLSGHNNGRPTTPAEAARLTLSLAQTIHAVHEAGILHRDLKPSNVLLTPAGGLKVSDFGLAKLNAGSSLLTAADSVLGTPSYMAPEQAVGEAHTIGPEADVYSLGAILYELLTGRPPFLGATVLDTLSMIRIREPVSPRQLQPRTPRDLETICLKCLAKAPRQRYVTAAALAEDLERFQQGVPILGRRPGALERFARAVKRKPVVSALLASVVLLACVLIAMMSINLHQRRQMSAAALVDSIATADAQSIPQLLARVSVDHRAILPLIRNDLSISAPGEAKWVNLLVANLMADPAADGEPLLDYLPRAHPTEVPVIVVALSPRSQALRAPLWRMLLDERAGDEARLHLACLAAQMSPDDPQWSTIASTVTRALVHQHPLDIGTLSAALRPARVALVPSLVAMTRDTHLEPLARHAAIGIIARFAADQPDVLLDLAVQAEPDEFRLLLPALEPHARSILPQLDVIAREGVSIEEISKEPAVQTKHEIDSAYDARERRRANALVLVWRLGDAEPALKALSRSGDPGLRAWLIELLAPLGVSSDSLWEQARNAKDNRVRQALILAIGQSAIQNSDRIDLPRLIPEIAKTYREDPNAGVHSACAWLLKTRLDSGAIVTEIGSAPLPISEARQWFVGANAHCFVVLRGPVTFTMGSAPGELLREPDEDLHDVRLEHSFAIADQEVSVAQFRQFRPDQFVHQRFSATEDCPMNNVSWFDAASYCRWLSEREGIAEDQMCYPPQDQITGGMKLPANFLQRTGYRLPTEAEWEYACRGGVAASRPCGEGGELLTRYAWYLSNSDDHAWPVGTLKPNDFGLFDMLGNVLERCQDGMQSESSGVVSDTDLRQLRGGEFGAASHNLRSARRHANLAVDRWASVGFRVARTVRP